MKVTRVLSSVKQCTRFMTSDIGGSLGKKGHAVEEQFIREHDAKNLKLLKKELELKASAHAGPAKKVGGEKAAPTVTSQAKSEKQRSG